SCYL
ncbi:hypothetical protein, partial [Plasmodium yoelii yoelii]